MSYGILVCCTAILGLLFLVVGCLIFFRKPIVKAWSIGMLGVTFILISTMTLMVAVNLFQFKPVHSSKAVLELSFARVAPQVYQVTLSDFDRDERSWVVKGDLWQVDAHRMVWGDVMARIGVRDGYRLNQLVGRYLALEQEGDMGRVPFQLTPRPKGPDLWHIAFSYAIAPLFTADRQVSGYMPMVDGGVFMVGFFEGEGLSVRPTNSAAQAAVDAFN